MIELINVWVFFFGIFGSIMFFALRFSRLARSYGKNRWLFGFVGAVCFIVLFRALAFLAISFGVASGYLPSYILIVTSIFGCMAIYGYLQKTWEKEN